MSWLTASAIHACCAVGAYGHASRLTACMTDESERSAVVATAMQILWQEERLDRARALRRFRPYEWLPDTELVWAEELLPTRPPEIGELDNGLSELVDHDSARVAVLTAVLASLDGQLNQAESTTSAARACIALGEVELARQILRRIEDRSRTRFDVLGRSDVLRCVARAGVRTGRIDLAKEVLTRAGCDDEATAARLMAAMAEASDADSLRLGSAECVVRGALDECELGRVLAVARAVPETSLRARALTGVLHYTINVGDSRSATKLLEWAAALAASARPRCQAVDRLAALAVEAARMGLPKQAVRLVEKARDLARAERFSATGHGPLLITVAGAAAEIGAIDLAGRLMLEVDHVSRQLGGHADSMFSFAQLAHRTGNADLAEIWLRRAERVADTQTNAVSRAWWIAQTARARGEIGDLAGARRLVEKAESVADTAESAAAGGRIRTLVANTVVGPGALDRPEAADDEASSWESRSVLAELLLETSWIAQIDDLARSDDRILGAVVHELFVVATRS
ncbi:hypothetical protein [Lentzea sp. NPDC051838]|uniref:hypothetical protein n=1 Tax=Lentzea sp. NPDC051838 TaxID=3154849 RepID=UPI00344A406B